MNAAAVLSLCASALQLGMGLLLVGLSRAPGWRAARSFALIALTASAYSAANVFFALPGYSDVAVVAASRVNYFVASLHCTAWLAYTHGGPNASPRRLSAPLKALATLLVGVGGFIVLTGWHVVPGAFADIDIPWARVAYRSPQTQPWAEWYGLVLVGSLLVPYSAFLARARAHEPGAVAHIIGFSLFFVCAVLEVLVSNGIVNTFFFADLGFLAVVVPVAIETVRRVVGDAGRLDALSRHLAGEVEARTEALDRAEHALHESERLAALGRLAAGVGHEINNPLTYLGLSLDAVESWAAHAEMPADVHDALVSARDGTDRIRRVVHGLRNVTRANAAEHRPLDVAALVRSALRVAGHHVQAWRIECEFASVPPVRGDEGQLVQVLVNLLTNAAQAMSDASALGNANGGIVVRVRLTVDADVAMEVSDAGPGISPENLRRLTEPYFTTRAEGGGTGLGLYLTRGILLQHGGRLEIESELGAGTTVRAVLPSLDQHTDSAETPEATETSGIQPSLPVRPCVLIVDDEPMLTRGLSRALAPHFDVIVANSGHDGLSRIAEVDTRIDAVICDVMMPGMSGIEFADALAASNPSLRRRTLFMTGGAVTATATEFLDRDDVHCVFKPVGGSELAAAIHSILTTADPDVSGAS